jgi:hypothetical protein
LPIVASVRSTLLSSITSEGKFDLTEAFASYYGNKNPEYKRQVKLWKAARASITPTVSEKIALSIGFPRLLQKVRASQRRILECLQKAKL